MTRIEVDEEPRPHEIIPDVFFGKDGPYEFAATKTGGVLSAYLLDADEDAVALAVMRAKMAWLERGFHPDDWKRLQDRLADPNDALEPKHLFSMYDKLIAAVTSRPPTLSPSSSTAPPGQSGVDAPRPRAATSGDSPQGGSAI